VRRAIEALDAYDTSRLRDLIRAALPARPKGVTVTIEATDGGYIPAETVKAIRDGEWKP
jgi:hypothetical protein